MKQLLVTDCLWPEVRQVSREEHPSAAPEQTVFAVFTGSGGSGTFYGLATAQEIAREPGQNFGALIKQGVIVSIPPDASAYQALVDMDRENLSMLPVLNALGEFMGVVTHQSIMQALVQYERSCLQELQYLRTQIEEQDRRAMVRMARLLQLEETSKKLLAALGLTSVETNLLQVGIEALTGLLRVRYGAIGILDEADESGETLKHFIYTGISPELAKSIGQLPRGRGLLGTVVHENVVLRLEKMSDDPRSVGFPPHHPRMNSLLAVPISYGRHVYGRIYLSEKLNGLPFTEEGASLVQDFSRSLGKALGESIKNGLNHQGEGTS